jgi:hypothetical protein
MPDRNERFISQIFDEDEGFPDSSVGAAQTEREAQAFRQFREILDAGWWVRDSGVAGQGTPQYSLTFILEGRPPVTGKAEVLEDAIAAAWEQVCGKKGEENG